MHTPQPWAGIISSSQTRDGWLDGQKQFHLFRTRAAVAQLHKQADTRLHQNLAECLFGISDRLVLMDIFLQFVQEIKAMMGRGWKNCTHSAGSVTRDPSSSPHSCSTPTYRHTARNIKYARWTNFSAMWCCDTEDYLHTTPTPKFTLQDCVMLDRNKMEVYFKTLEYQIEIKNMNL